ncbi:MAG: urate hydroxylase PuuD [Deltaproteobacteria bacterium]|nr:urate hydroxylase PuuD [Deltaproteobacteria bacterium]
MDVMNLTESLFRWLHVFFGILWIGLLYFFNWVNGPFAATMDAETKKKVVPELMPRALFWFRWGAAFTWITGVFLLLLVYYHMGAVFPGGVRQWTGPILLMVALVFIAPFIYDALYKGPLKDPTTGFWAGLGLVFVVLLLFDRWAGFSFRGTAIHLGSMFGTTMAYNVWFRIWPSQRTIITAVKNGQAPDAAIVALAGTRSKHNTYMSVPLVFTMISQHATWAATATPISLTIVVLVGWGLVSHVYERAKNVKGF